MSKYHSCASLDRMIRRLVHVIFTANVRCDINAERLWPSFEVASTYLMKTGIPIVRDGIVLKNRDKFKVVSGGIIFAVHPELVAKINEMLVLARPRQYGTNVPFTVDDLFAEEKCHYEAHVG